MKYLHPASALHKFLKAQEGVALIEFIIALTVLIPLFVGIIDISNYIKAHQRLDTAATNLLNLINQRKEIDANTIHYLAESTSDILGKFSDSGWGVVVTAVNKPNIHCAAYSLWQIRSGPFSTMQSNIANGADQVVNHNLPLREENDQVIVVEIKMHFSPILDAKLVKDILGLSEGDLYKFSVARPRYGSFTRNPMDGTPILSKCL
jgi:Flp pilus assembly protein TadG